MYAATTVLIWEGCKSAPHVFGFNTCGYALRFLQGVFILTFTRPDISDVVQQICLHMHDPREPHLAALKRVLHYVRGTLDFRLQLYASPTSSLLAYTDADCAGCPTTIQTTLGYCVFFGDNLLSWSSKRQHTISRSSAEAEYCGVANVVAETAWLCNLLRELHTPLLSATLVYCDNVSTIYMTANLVQHNRTKHIEIDIHFVRDMVARGQVRVLHVPSRYQYTDIFTKGLPSALFEEFCTSLSVRSSPTQTTGECIDLMQFLKKKLGNGENTSFWDDKWHDDGPFKSLYPRLHALETCKSISVASKLSQPSLIHSFRRPPRGGVEEEQFSLLGSRTTGISLPNMCDRWFWSLESSGDFSVKSTRICIDDNILPKNDVPTK
ncbi:ribonuclease H-like domain-containing protein [Tanacetum coccineum]